MNIEIANRLVQLRKQNHLSQEELASRLGISRQAVSKWERAEASPDTDNLILLSRLYGVSLDELVRTEDEIPMPDPQPEPGSHAKAQTDDPTGKADTGDAEPDQTIYIGWKRGIHVHDGRDEVHVGWDGIHVKEHGGDNVHIGRGHVFVNGKEYPPHRWHLFPFSLLVSLAYLILGFACNAWHPGWLVFLLIPLYHSLGHAIAMRNPHCFAFPVLVALLYLYLGFTQMWWHPGWVLFLTIPLYYCLTKWLWPSKAAPNTSRQDGR